MRVSNSPISADLRTSFFLQIFNMNLPTARLYSQSNTRFNWRVFSWTENTKFVIRNT